MKSNLCFDGCCNVAGDSCWIMWSSRPFFVHTRRMFKLKTLKVNQMWHYLSRASVTVSAAAVHWCTGIKSTPLQTATPAVIVNLALLCEKCWMKCAKPFNIPCMLSSQKVGLSLRIFWIESSCYWSIAIEVKERSVEISSSWYVVFSQGFYLQENLIEFVDLKDLNNLYMLNLSHNKLTSIHGLDSCTRLCWLNLAHNKLTQLGEGLCDIDLIRLNDTLWF